MTDTEKDFCTEALQMDIPRQSSPGGKKKKIQTGRHFLAGTEFWTFNCEHIVSCFLRFFLFYLIHLLDCGALLTLCLKVGACESTRVVKYFILRAGYRLFELLGQKLNYCYIIYCYKTIRKGIIN